MTPTPQQPGSPSRRIPMGILITFIATATLFVLAVAMWKAGPEGVSPLSEVTVDVVPAPEGMTSGDDAAELRAWLAQADDLRDASYGGVGFGGGIAVRTMATEEAAMPTMAEDGDAAVTDKAVVDGELGLGGAGRISETNVQTVGIDEPDIVKTDGERIFFSPETYYGWPAFDFGDGPIIMKDADGDESVAGSEGAVAQKMIAVDSVGDERMIAPGEPYPGYVQPTTKVIGAFPPEDLALIEGIERTGELLLADDVLMVFAYDGVYAYDVSGEKAERTWAYAYGENHELVTVRLRGDEVFLVQRAGIDRNRPCPIVPLRGEASITVPCGDVWHPIAPTPSDVTYTVSALDAATGAVRASTAFLGGWSSTATYMATDDIYVTWQLPVDTLRVMMRFISEENVFPSDFKTSVAALSNIGISDRAKMTELQVLLEEWMGGMDRDDQLLVSTELANRADDFVERHQRDFVRTGIARIAVDGLKVAADGTVPGTLLNQFSLDEYDGHLRVATTSGGRGVFGWQFGFGGADKSVNDVYVLDKDLNETGSVLDLGRGERIYSARFVGDEGYVVTFKQIDPFYVIDLSNPNAPRMAGELKIPGYSSYLHPIGEDLVLGVGQEEWRVKLSLFDVSDSSNPVEKAKYVLDEGWSEVQSTHHAFLLDREHGVFFLPGGQGGYVFSYEGDLELVKAVSDVQARRAIYLDDYLYVIGNDSIVVLDENTWERVGELKLTEKR